MYRIEKWSVIDLNITFCGHRKLDNKTAITSWLNIVLPSLIEGGASTFYLGGYGDFDYLAAKSVRHQKKNYVNIKGVLVLPYTLKSVDISIYDRVIYPLQDKIDPRFAIVKRNQWMVEASDVIISGVAHDWGGAAGTLAYAQEKKKIIVQYPYK